jgi:hypothetical protein
MGGLGVRDGGGGVGESGFMKERRCVARSHGVVRAKSQLLHTATSKGCRASEGKIRLCRQRTGSPGRCAEPWMRWDDGDGSRILEGGLESWQ